IEAEQVIGRLRSRRWGRYGSRTGATSVAATVAGADVRILLLRERGGGGVGATIRGLVHRMAGMPLDPLELDAATGERAIDVLEQIDVQHGLAVLLAPALALPSRHPLRDRVDHVLAVAQDQQVLVGVLGGGLEQVEHGLQLAHVVGAVGPAARAPGVLVDVPGPAGRPGIAEGGAVGGCSDAHGLNASTASGVVRSGPGVARSDP